MSTINFIALVAAILVLALYGIYVLYFSGPHSTAGDINLRKKLGKVFTVTEEKEEEKSASLVKLSPDSYFKSKLPKIEGIKEWIQHAGLNINPSVIVISGALIGLTVLIALSLGLHVHIVVSILVGIVCSCFIPWVVISFLISRRKNIFLEEFPIALDIIRRALRAGHSVDRAMTMVVEQVKGPVGEAFRQMVDKLRLGGSFNGVLAEMANRIGIDDFRMLAIVIVLQRETGGSLAESIDNFSKITRARQFLRKKVKALTAEVRVTSMILTAIPFCIFGLVYFTTPGYFDPLFYTENGQILLISGILMLVVGIGVIIRMTYKERY